MKPATEEAATAAAPELIPNQWTDDGFCRDPETLAIDFGKKGAPRRAIVSLGCCPDGSWRAGFECWDKKGQRQFEAVRETGEVSPSRALALRQKLGFLCGLFASDKIWIATLEAFFDKVCFPSAAAAAAKEKTAAACDLPPLPEGKFSVLPVSKIESNPENARKEFEPLSMKELAASIQEVGLLAPICVRRLLADELDELPGVAAAVKAERYEIIAGERRHRAHIMLARDAIACIVYEGVTRRQAKAAALVENLQREGLNAIEEAEGYRDLMKSQGLTQEQCAERVGKSRPVVANALRVLELPEKVLKLLRDGKLTHAHGVALAKYKAFPKAVAVMAEEAIRQGISANFIEKGLPFEDELEDAAAIVKCYSHEVGGEYPTEIKKHAAYLKLGGVYVCFEPAHWLGLVKEYKAEEAEKAKAARERELKKAQKKGGMKSLADLPRSAYVEVRQKDPVLAALLPDDTIEDAKQQWGPGKVEICTRPALYKKIDEAIVALRNADRKEKLVPLVEKARKAILGTKKLGQREQTLLLLAATIEGGGCIHTDSAKRQGVKFPGKLLGWNVRLNAECVAAAHSLDTVEYYRVIVDDLFEGRMEDDADSVGGFDPTSESASLVKYLLELDDFGLLEETKAGQNQLVDTVKASDWYKKEIAAIEAEETAGKGKAGK